MNETKKFNWGYLIIGVLFLVVSFMSLNNPETNLLAIVMYVGFGAVAKGCFELFNRKTIPSLTGVGTNLPIWVGIIDIVIGCLMLFNLGISLAILPYVFACWFLVDSIHDLLFANVYKDINPPMYWFSIISNILGIILGILLLFNPITSAFTLAFLVGAYFMITGVTYIVAAFR
ncbi:HdeD family acid-resistance protein [Vagococcus xieshaowenii]|uniref:Acid-resistance membrane protein n=1 Tax=Vagococcus xieshaowenii TaxID=2562451 RepID=A0AAJ5JQF1_9ENTE|nr:DUF308 domain-containing protein [Vagococcus xieshaowenii]QCA28549.1 hypothetical protein E4Z98_04175 [Vagococcus xieshaowenii]TFZ40643.1 hypothetical protein E4031_07600 [Vagococcus xieshaowenii]